MPSITATPDPADPSSVVTIDASGFGPYPARVLLDGTVAATDVTPTAGAFSIDVQASDIPKTQSVVGQSKHKRRWVTVASTSFTVQAISTPDSPPSPDGWDSVFFDDFSSWNPGDYFVYPNTWTNNYTGRYDPTIISSDGSKLRIYLHTDANGTPRIAAFCPLPTGALSAKGDLNSLRYEFSIRADRMPGYKGVPLLWPQSGDWPTDGEIDWPESHFDAQPAGFMHRQAGTSGSDQDYCATPAGTSWQDWHKYALEWVSGTSCTFLIDDEVQKTVTSRVPSTPMHLVMQFETQLNLTKPSPLVSGYVEIEYLQIWVPS